MSITNLAARVPSPVALLLIAGLVPIELSAQMPTIRLDGVDGSAGAALRVEGQPGSNYVVEASQNLGYWFELGGGLATGGELNFRHSRAANYSRLAYRARLDALEPSLNVQPQVDSNYLAVAIIGPNGGSFSLEAPDQTLFTLRVPTNALLEDTLLQMTLITNVTGITHEPGPRAAVKLEPEGLYFHGMAELDIRFPFNIPGNRMSSYKFGEGGSEFHLTPDRMSSNRVTIYLPHFSGGGTGRFSPESRATFAAKGLQNALDRLSRRIAEQLGEARQRELNEVVGDEIAMEDLLDPDIINDLENRLADEIDAQLDEFGANCALAKKVVPIALGLERQRQLLGAKPGESTDRLGQTLDRLTARFCDAFENCKQELLDRCFLDGPSMDIVRELLGLARQAQLLGAEGGGCGNTDIEEALRQCAPIWFGEISYTEQGETNSFETFGNSTTFQERKKNYRFTAYVNTSEEDAFEGTVVISATLDARVSGSESQHETITTTVSCDSGTEPTRSEYFITDLRMAGDDKLRLRFDCSIQDGVPFFLQLGSDATMPPIAIRGPDLRKHITVDCNGNQTTPIDLHGVTRSSYGPNAFSFFGPGTVPASIHVTTNAITGSYTTNAVRDDVPITMTYRFDLRRQ